HRDDHYGLKHLDELLGDEGVHREPTLRDRGEEQRGEHHAERMVSTDERHRDPEESAAARETFLVIVLVAEHVIQAAQTGDRAGESHHTSPQVADIYATVFGCGGLQSNSAQLEPASRSEEVPPGGN